MERIIQIAILLSLLRCVSMSKFSILDSASCSSSSILIILFSLYPLFPSSLRLCASLLLTLLLCVSVFKSPVKLSPFGSRSSPIRAHAGGRVFQNTVLSGSHPWAGLFRRQGKSCQIRCFLASSKGIRISASPCHGYCS